MACRIIIDSGGECTEAMRKDDIYQIAPLSIEIDGEIFVDETISQKELLERIASSPNCPKSSCPAPEKFMELYHCDAENVYVVSISSELSGTYNSAILGRTLYSEEYGKKNIHIFDSKSASVGQTNVALKIRECEDNGMSFEDVIECVESYIREESIYFVLESLETLRKNGRLSGVKSVVATALNIKPLLAADEKGTIVQLGQARGMKKALTKMVEELVANVQNPREKVLGIGHCNNRKDAEFVKGLVEQKTQFKSIYITETSGISTMYASDGGVLMSV